MTTDEITRRQARDAMKYEVAKQLRNVLDEASKQYETLEGDWAGDDMESEIQTLVFEEG